MRSAEQVAGAVLCCRTSFNDELDDDIDKATAIIGADRAALVEEIAEWVVVDSIDPVLAKAIADDIRAHFGKAAEGHD